MSVQSTLKSALLAGVAGTLLAGTATAAEPVTLTDAQLDEVSAGAFVIAAVGLTFGFQSTNLNGLNFTEQAQTATVAQLSVKPTGLISLDQTQAFAGLTATMTSNGGGLFDSFGQVAAGGSANF